MTPRKPKHLHKPSGRPTKYRVEFNERAYRMALLGATEAEIAEWLDISVSKFEQWKQKYPKFREAIKNGSLPADAEAAHSLFQRVKGYEGIYEKTLDEHGKVIETKMRYIGPDVRACEIWLRNRRRKQWASNEDPPPPTQTLNLITDPDTARRLLENLRPRAYVADRERAFLDAVIEDRSPDNGNGNGHKHNGHE